jgi:DNA helicase II / ATP-dependent DNA helicase PcrA
MKSSKATPAFAFSPDEHQRKAIEHVHGPMLVVAGAGTGKTTVLTRRITRLIREGHARADEILALTYTDNAAREMRERVQSEVATHCKVQATTFHAYCFSLLERRGRKFGVLDDKDLWIYLRKRIRDLHLNYFVRAANVSKFLDDLLDFMRRCQDELVGPEKYSEYVRRLERSELPIPRVTRSKDAPQVSDQEVLGRCQEIASVFKIVESMLASENLGTFGHMISRAYELLSKDPEMVARERAAARFILVDEFQDANFAQVKILGLLAGDERNIFAVGDPDQAIYRFRGASSAAFGLFHRNFPGARLVSLQKNQRSLAPILQCAYAVVAKNPPVFSAGVDSPSYRRLPLSSAREEAKETSDRPSELVQAVVWRDRELESADLVGVIRQQHRRLRYPWKKFAIIYRNHAHRDEVVEELSRWNIPYAIESMDVLDTPEVRDLLACMGAAVSVQDSASLFRVAALPQFGIDPEFLRLAMKAARRDITLALVLEQVTGGSGVLKKLEEAREQIKARQAKARTALEFLIRHFQLDRNSPALNAVLQFAQNWEQKAVTKTGEIAELLEYLEYFREARGSINLESQTEDAVRLMTAHGAKGLEFDHVFILRAYSGCFPSGFKEQLFEFPRELRDPDSVAEDEGKHLNDQEERRLLYVAMTRARDSLTIYAKQGVGKDPTPPGFVRDLLKDNSLARVLLRREARPVQVDLFAEEQPAEGSLSNASQWLSMEPTVLLTTTLSATSIERYELCPLQFKLEREWRIPGEVPAAMQYGASIHRVLRAYYDGVRFGRPMSDEVVLQFFRDDLAQARIEDCYQHDLYETQGLEQLRDFLAKARTGPQPEVMFTEQEFKIRIADANVVGRIDRVDRMPGDAVAIFDYKTGKPRSQEDADESLQLSIYALAAAETWGVKPSRLLFYNLEDNTAVSTSRSELQLQDARARVGEVAEKIAAREFEAKTGFHCSFCAYRILCPATEKRIYSIAPAKQAASRGN